MKDKATLYALFDEWWEQNKPPVGLYDAEQENGLKTCSRHAYLSGVLAAATGKI